MNNLAFKNRFPISKRSNFQAVHRRSPHLDSGWFGFLGNLNEIQISGVLELVSCDRAEWAYVLGFQHQREVHRFLAELLISLIMSRSCSDYQPIKERNYDDFHQSTILIGNFSIILLAFIAIVFLMQNFTKTSKEHSSRD